MSLCLTPLVTGESRAYEHRRNFRASGWRSFPQDTNHFCATVDRPAGNVSDSRVEAQYHCPECREVGPQVGSLLPLTFTSSGGCTSPSGSSTRTPSMWGQFVIVLVMKAPRAGRRVAWNTDRDSTRTMVTNTRTALEIVSVLHHNSQQRYSLIKSMTSINGVGFGWSENRCTGTRKSPCASF